MTQQHKAMIKQIKSLRKEIKGRIDALHPKYQTQGTWKHDSKGTKDMVDTMADIIIHLLTK